MKLIIVIFTLICESVFALTPLEGIILGKVTVPDYKLASNFNGIKAGPKIDEIKNFLLEGEALENSCLAPNVYTYLDQNSENVAKSTIISNLQYLGINLSLRAIVTHAKSLRIGKDQFKTLVENLVNKTCSANFSVYSKKLLRNNFYKLFDSGNSDLLFKFNHLSLSDSIKNEIESKAFVSQSFEYSVRNFRSFCSWDGDTSDYRLIGKYLEDRYTMAYLKNFIISEKVPQKILCEDSICKEVDTKYMLKNIPRVSGTINMSEDMRLLYCNKYSMNKKLSLNGQIKKWQQSQTKESKVKEVLNFNSLLNGTPNLSLLSNGMHALKDVLKMKVKEEWSEWSKRELSRFSLDLLYEEPLQIDLVNKEYSSDYLQGKLALDFQYSLGELDLLSENLNKLSAKFTIQLNKKFIQWFYKEYNEAKRKRNFTKIEELENRLDATLAQNFEEKEKYFNLKVWTKEISTIASKELIRQIGFYRSKDLEFNTELNDDSISLDVNLTFGLFALKYFKEKASIKKLTQTLTSK